MLLSDSTSRRDKKRSSQLNNRKNEEIEEIHEQNANALTRLSAAHATEINAALELIIRVRDVNSKKEAFKEVGAAHGISADKQAIRKLLNEKNQAIWAKKNTVGGVGALAAGNGDVKIEGGGAQKIKVEPGGERAHHDGAERRRLSFGAEHRDLVNSPRTLPPPENLRLLKS